MEMRRGGREVGFQGGTYSLKTINIQHVFILYSHKYILGKTNLDFQNTHEFKDLKLFKVL